MKYPIIRSGVFRFSDIATSGAGELSIFKFVKNLLTYFNITVADPCCPTTTSPTRYNEVTNILEYYNQVTDTWDSAQTAVFTSNAWNLIGNSGTNSNTNFIGTTDNVDFRFKRNNLNSGYLAGANTAFGLNSGNSTTESGLNPTQFGNVSIGISAGNNSVGNENTFFGNGAGASNTDDQVTCIGLGAGYRNSGLNLAALGFSAGSDNSGVNSTALGASSGWNNSGDNVISIGLRSNENNTGDKVIALGENAGKNNTQSNRFIIGQNYLPTFADEAAAIAAGLPLPSVNGIYLYIDASTKNVRARI
jgi:hypothetical protein